MNPKYNYNTSDVGYMDEEWENYIPEHYIEEEKEKVIDDEEKQTEKVQ